MKDCSLLSLFSDGLDQLQESTAAICSTDDAVLLDNE